MSTAEPQQYITRPGHVAPTDEEHAALVAEITAKRIAQDEADRKAHQVGVQPKSELGA